MTPSIGGAGCCAAATPTTSEQARRLRQRRGITLRSADFDSSLANTVRYIFAIFIFSSVIIFCFYVLIPYGTSRSDFQRSGREQLHFFHLRSNRKQLAGSRS